MKTTFPACCHCSAKVEVSSLEGWALGCNLPHFLFCFGAGPYHPTPAGIWPTCADHRGMLALTRKVKEVLGRVIQLNRVIKLHPNTDLIFHLSSWRNWKTSIISFTQANCQTCPWIFSFCQSLAKATFELSLSLTRLLWYSFFFFFDLLILSSLPPLSS